MPNNATDVEIYTDGACRGNPGIGGWGALLRFRESTRELNGACENTTNNRMELLASIEALAALKRPCKVLLWTDSKYLKDGITEWISNWKRRNWRTAANKPVKNDDLWRRLDELVQRHTVEWRWVKGHAGNAGNETADRLANEAIDHLLTGSSSVEPEEQP